MDNRPGSGPNCETGQGRIEGGRTSGGHTQLGPAMAAFYCNYNPTSHARRCCNHCPTPQATPGNIRPHLHARIVLDLRWHRRRGRRRRHRLRCGRHRGAWLLCQLRCVPLGVQKFVQVASNEVHQGCMEQGGWHDQLPQMHADTSPQSIITGGTQQQIPFCPHPAARQPPAAPPV